MAGRRWDDPWQRYRESVPLAVEGGLATSRQRGAMAGTWWSQRFVDVLDAYGLGTRLRRGRRYARAGQVLSFEVTSGLLVAQVQGSRRTPYLVSVRAAPPTEDSWTLVEQALRDRVGFVARLLDGEVPPELEDVCGDAGIELLPTRWASLTAECNCPDWENPCKHLAAVLYVFADRLDADPWLLFQWRGRTREQLLAHLEALSGGGRLDGLPSWWPLVPGRTDARRAWRAPEASVPDPPHAVLARLAQLDVDIDGTPVTELLTAAYAELTRSPDADDPARQVAGSEMAT
jgi:hypothetical protein